MAITTEGTFTKEDEEATFGANISGANVSDQLGRNVANRLSSIDRFEKNNYELPDQNFSHSLTDMTEPIFLQLTEVTMDAIPSNQIIFGRVGDDSIEGNILRGRVYNPYFILNDSITQDLSVYRRPSDSRLEQSVDDNIFDLAALSTVNPFKNMTLRDFDAAVANQIDSMSRLISNIDNRSDFVQDFKKDANVSPEDYKKLKIRKASSTELRGMNRKRSTSV
jgi:hypothetical protein